MAAAALPPSFASFGLDDRLTRAVLKAKYTKPTLVQATAIPIALEGRDVLCRAKTGSGKTVAYSLPVLQKILVAKSANPDLKAVQALILVPTRELCEQVGKNIKQMAFYCSRFVSHVQLTADAPLDVQKRALADLPDIIVATPGRIVAHLDAGNVVLKDSLQTLVIDEADLVLSFGFDEDVRRIVSQIPNVVQTLLMSATLNADVEQLKQLVLKKAAILRLEEGSDEQTLTQFYVITSDEEKYLLLYFILRLKLVQGKAIIFVNNIERCYKVKLFLEQFGIKSCVLNSELPQNSRYHIVDEFNRGIYDYIIATDESQQIIPAVSTPAPAPSTTISTSSEDPEAMDTTSAPAAAPDVAVSAAPPSKKSKKASKRDAEFGVARGVDFKDVAAVFNFDFPTSLENYTHRVGRTARAGKEGTALSFVVDKDEDLLKETRKHFTDDEGAVGTPAESSLKPFKFKMDEVNAFRYRVDDALRAVTRSAIREARLKEIKTEIINSEKLKAHFEDNPNDLAALRHDKTLLQGRVNAELKHVPTYLLPKDRARASAAGDVNAPEGGESATTAGTDAPVAGMMLFKKKNRQWNDPRKAQKKRKNDPLKSYSYKSGSSVGGKKKKTV